MAVITIAADESTAHGLPADECLQAEILLPASRLRAGAGPCLRLLWQAASLTHAAPGVHCGRGQRHGF